MCASPALPQVCLGKGEVKNKISLQTGLNTIYVCLFNGGSKLVSIDEHTCHEMSVLRLLRSQCVWGRGVPP